MNLATKDQFAGLTARVTELEEKLKKLENRQTSDK
jgi:polyhydroxyalkanoate synthesis regulator phasin